MALVSNTRATGLWPVVLVVGLAGLLILSSCGEDEGPDADLTAAEHNEEGWSSYILGDYGHARGHFAEALRIDAGLHEARLGLAWCEAQAGVYLVAVNDFNQVIESGALTKDAFAGRAAAALEVPDDSLAAASAESTLARDLHYYFVRRPEYNFYDLRLILAQAYFALSEYSYAQEQVDILDPGNGLDPAEPSTWVVSGVLYPTYEAALAIEIERLWALEEAPASNRPGS